MCMWIEIGLMSKAGAPAKTLPSVGTHTFTTCVRACVRAYTNTYCTCTRLDTHTKQAFNAVLPTARPTAHFKVDGVSSKEHIWAFSSIITSGFLLITLAKQVCELMNV